MHSSIDILDNLIYDDFKQPSAESSMVLIWFHISDVF